MIPTRPTMEQTTKRIVHTGLRVAARHDGVARLLDRALAPFNPFSPQRYRDPYPLYEQLRPSGPVFHHRRAGLWLISGYAESVEFLRAPLSSTRLDDLRHQHPYRRLRADNIDLMSKAILMQDPPDHTRLRRTVSRTFTPRAIERMAPRIDELANELLDELERTASRGGARGRPVDVMTTFADRLPVYVIAEMLGVPTDRWNELKALSDHVSAFVEPYVGFDHREMDAAIDRFRAMFGELADERRRHPETDILTTMAELETCPAGRHPRLRSVPTGAAAVAGSGAFSGADTATVDRGALDRDELVAMAILLLLAGNETTSGLISNSIIALHRHPVARERLQAEPALAADAIDELIRFDSPVQVTDRSVLEDIELAGHRVPAGSIVVVLIGAANRDPMAYDWPNELLLDRPSPRPLSFGHGIHHCLGAALARLQAAAAIRAFIERFPDHRVDEAGIAWKRSISLRGATRLPVALHG